MAQVETMPVSLLSHKDNKSWNHAIQLHKTYWMQLWCYGNLYWQSDCKFWVVLFKVIAIFNSCLFSSILTYFFSNHLLPHKQELSKISQNLGEHMFWQVLFSLPSLDEPCQKINKPQKYEAQYKNSWSEKHLPIDSNHQKENKVNCCQFTNRKSK